MNGELFGLAVQGLLRKKRSSLLLFAVLLLSFAFALISLTVTGSIRKTNEEYLYDTYGTWYGAIANGQDADEVFLREQAWLDELGITKNYGTIQASSSGSTGIGIMDESFLRIGRIGLQDGRFPQSTGEIAMEADLLSALGYDYTLGQEVTFTVSLSATAYVDTGDGSGPKAEIVTIPVEQTFTLCGVIREYANLWVRSGSVPLNSAMIIQEDAETLWQSAQKAAQELRTAMTAAMEKGEVAAIVLDALVPQYYFSVLPGGEAEMREQVSEYLASTRAGAADGAVSETTVCVNTPAFSGRAREESNATFFAGVILIVTLLSVVCVYAIRLQDEARQLAVFRSIGVTNRQLCLMLLYETLCLGVPAMLLGAVAGTLGTWALLRLAVYSGSAPIRVVIPPALLAAAAALWLLGVLAVRLAAFLVALRAPLTGRFHIARRSARRNRNLQQVLIMGLSALLCAAVMFTTLESLGPYNNAKTWNSLEDYRVTVKGYSGGDLLFSGGTDHRLYSDTDMTVPKQAVAQFVQIPGVSYAWGFGSRRVRLAFDGMDDVPLADSYRKLCLQNYTNEDGLPLVPFGVGPYDPDAMFVSLLIVDDGDWTSVIDFDIDLERFRSGDAVLMSFSVDSNGMFIPMNGLGQAFAETGISVGDTIRLTIGTPRVYAETEVEVGGFNCFTPSDERSLVDLTYSYTVICSEAFLGKLLDSLGPGQAWHEFRQGTSYGYGSVYVYADLNAEYLSTDAVLAELCAREGLQMTSYRELYHGWAQENLQSLILLLTGGGCVALVLLLVLGNTLSMEAERQKRSYGILQALGMSRRQLKLRQFGIALGRGALAGLLGWLSYGGYCVIWAVREQERVLVEFGTERSLQNVLTGKLSVLTRYYGSWSLILLLTVFCITVVLFVSWLAKRRLFRDDLMAKLRDEH